MVNEIASPPAPSTEDAITLLRGDHRRIEAMLVQCQQSAAPDAAMADADRSGVLSRLGALMAAHMQVEFELFYPVLVATPPITPAAIAEHAEIEARLQTLATLDLSGGDYAERLDALAALVREHIEHEELHLFPAAAALDLAALGTRMALRRGELLGDYAID